MGSVSINGFSVANLFQNVTGAGPPQPVASPSSPTVPVTFQNAPTTDSVDISGKALKLQQINPLSGNAHAAETATLASGLYPLTAHLISADAPGATAASSSIPSLASQLTEDRSGSTAEEMKPHFGIASSVYPAGSMVDAPG